MALPAGLTPKTVTFGLGSFFDGTLVDGTVSITAPVNVLHVPTGSPIFSSAMQKKLVAGEATFDLCPTDHPDLNRVDWTYKLTVKINGALVQPDPINFTLPVDGPDTVDLDSLVSVPSSAGTPVSVQVLTAADLDPLTAGYVDDDTSATSAALRAASVAAALASSDVLALGAVPRSHQEATLSAFHGINYKRAALSFRFDDGQNTDQAVFNLLTARGLVAGFAIPTGYVGAAAGTVVDPPNNGISSQGQMTAATLLTLQANGMEIMHHTQTHSGPPADYDTFVAETSTSRTALAALGPFYVDTFVPPGPWGAGGYAFTSDADFNTPEGQVLRANYAASFGATYDGMGSYRFLPATHRYGVGYLTGDKMSLAALQASVDQVIALGLGVQITFHTWMLDTVGNITTADLTSFLDYVAAKRDTGLLDVLTPTGMGFATRADHKTSMLYDGAFEEQATGAFQGWVPVGAPTVSAGGHRQGNYVTVTDTSASVYQLLLGQNARSVRVEGWARAVSGTGYPRLIVKNYNASESFAYSSADYKPGATTTTWRRVAVNVGGHPAADHFKIWLAAEAASSCEWSDIKVYRQ